MAIITSLDALNASQKEELVASLAVFLVGSTAEGSSEMSADALLKVAAAAGCTLSGPVATLFSSVASKVPGGKVEVYKAPPGGGGGGGGGGAASGGGGGGAAAEEAKPEEKEEEEEMDLGGGMDMFGAEEGGGGGGDY